MVPFQQFRSHRAAALTLTALITVLWAARATSSGLTPSKDERSRLKSKSNESQASVVNTPHTITIQELDQLTYAYCLIFGVSRTVLTV